MYPYSFSPNASDENKLASEDASGPSPTGFSPVSPYLQRPLRSLEQVLLSRAARAPRD